LAFLYVLIPRELPTQFLQVFIPKGVSGRKKLAEELGGCRGTAGADPAHIIENIITQE
jgi:hypothetical protein